MTTKELYDKYDALTFAAVTNIYTLAKEKGRLVLTGINPSDDGHMFFIHAAFTAKDIVGMQVEVACSWWRYLRLCWKLRHCNQKVKKAPKYTFGIFPTSVLQFMEPLVQKLELDSSFRWGDIYRAFYSEDGKKGFEG